MNIKELKAKTQEFVDQLNPIFDKLRDFECEVNRNVTGEDEDVAFEEAYNVLSEALACFTNTIITLEEVVDMEEEV